MLKLNSELYSLRGIVKCAECGKRIAIGEKYIQIIPNIHNLMYYINLCNICTRPFGKRLGEEGDGIKEYNQTFLAMPEKERRLKFKMVRKITGEIK